MKNIKNNFRKIMIKINKQYARKYKFKIHYNRASMFNYNENNISKLEKDKIINKKYIDIIESLCYKNLDLMQKNKLLASDNEKKTNIINQLEQDLLERDFVIKSLKSKDKISNDKIIDNDRIKLLSEEITNIKNQIKLLINNQKANDIINQLEQEDLLERDFVIKIFKIKR